MGDKALMIPSKISTNQMRISPKYTSSDWLELKFDQETDWPVAIRIFRDRIEGRFLRYIRKIASYNFSGFAVMALDCLLIETLQQFYEGAKETPVKKSGAYFVKFFTSGIFKECFTEEIAKIFYSDVRNGILHQAEIKRNSKISIKRLYPVVSLSNGKTAITVNRRLFHSSLLEEYDAYLRRLANPEEKKLRNNFRKKMNYICQTEEII